MMLNIQYRMDPHIARLVSRLFYNNQLLKDQSVVFRQDDTKWLAFNASIFADCPRQHSIFINTTAGPLYYTVRGRPLANPRHACIVDRMLTSLKKAGAAPNEIAVLCGYKAQLRVLRTLPSTAGVTLATNSSRFMEQQQLSETLGDSCNLASAININYMEMLENDRVEQNGESQAVLIYFDVSRYRESRLGVFFFCYIEELNKPQHTLVVFVQKRNPEEYSAKEGIRSVQNSRDRDIHLIEDRKKSIAVLNSFSITSVSRTPQVLVEDTTDECLPLSPWTPTQTGIQCGWRKIHVSQKTKRLTRITWSIKPFPKQPIPPSNQEGADEYWL